MSQPAAYSTESFDAAEFRAFMARFPTGVAVVTTLDEHGMPRGMTCSSVCSVTLSPPTLLVCLRAASPTVEAVLARGAFSVNLLHDGASGVARLFASGAPDRFDRIDWRIGAAAAGPHLHEMAHAIADCVVSRADLVGDHVVVFGEVAAVSHPTEYEPLLYGLHRYAAWPAAEPA
ncbi:MAG TPA: flavin reductase family protein [Jatrophihabitans sp.]|nr:flavin reductase family protein [Jatrophihabitans sp.]